MPIYASTSTSSAVYGALFAIHGSGNGSSGNGVYATTGAEFGAGVYPRT